MFYKLMIKSQYFCASVSLGCESCACFLALFLHFRWYRIASGIWSGRNVVPLDGIRIGKDVFLGVLRFAIENTLGAFHGNYSLSPVRTRRTSLCALHLKNLVRFLEVKLTKF